MINDMRHHVKRVYKMSQERRAELSEREYLTVQEAAEFAEVTRKTVYRWISLGFLTPYARRRGDRRVRGTLVQRVQLEDMVHAVERVTPA